MRWNRQGLNKKDWKEIKNGWVECIVFSPSLEAVKTINNDRNVKKKKGEGEKYKPQTWKTSPEHEGSGEKVIFVL